MINNNEYSPAELQSFVSIIHSNVIGALRGGIRFAEEEVGVKWKENVIQSVNYLKDLESVVLNEEVGEHCIKVWESSDFQMNAMRYTIMSRSPSEVNLSSKVLKTSTEGDNATNTAATTTATTTATSDSTTTSTDGGVKEDGQTTVTASSSTTTDADASNNNNTTNNNASNASTATTATSASTSAEATSSSPSDIPVSTATTTTSSSKVDSDDIDDYDDDDEEKVKWTMEDGAIYFMNHLGRISSSKYVPTSQDILHARQKSTGIIETQFESNNALFRIVDVGGQRSERKKWSMLFSDITGIIFCADVSCYDTPLREDPDVNRMVDSLATFQQICNNRDLQSRDIILFLNKTDLLAKKIKRSPFPADIFPGAPSGPNITAEDALKFIQGLYLAKNAHPTKFIYTHQTIATDTSSIKAAFTEIVKEIVRKDNVLASF